MRKAAEWIRTLLGNMLAVGLSVQILYGLGWMLASFGKPPQFGEAQAGLLYPALIQMARGFEAVFRIPYYCFLSVLQLGCAGAVSFSGLLMLRGKQKGRRDRLWAFWGSLVLLTIPMAMQCHLAPLPYSLAASGLFLELVLVWRLLRKKTELTVRELSALFLCWLVCALLLPEYGIFGALPLFLLLTVRAAAWRTRGPGRPGSVWWVGVFLTAAGFAAAAGGCLAQAYPIEVTVCSRIAWSSINGYYGDWPEDIIGAVTYETVLDVASNPEKLEQELWPMLLEQQGEERARQMLGEISRLTWDRSKTRVLRQAVWDMAGYAIPSFVVPRQLDGKAYASYTGRNYDIMRWYAPGWTYYYLQYSCWMFLTGLALAAALQLLRLRQVWQEKGWSLAALAVLTGGEMVLWYTLQGGGRMDYKKTIVLTAFWYVWMLCRTGGELQRGEEEKGGRNETA